MAKYKITPCKTTRKENLIEICLHYEHGDADKSEEEIFSFTADHKLNLDDFAEFCNKLKLASSMIDGHRYHSKDIDPELLTVDNEIVYKDFSVELPRDCIYDYRVVNMSVGHAVYYDEVGSKYVFEAISDE